MSLQEIDIGERDDVHSPDYWVVRINGVVRNQVESFIETGRLLIEAKEHLRHGDFTDMIERRLHIGPRMCQKYMKVAGHRVLANPKHASLLPPAIDTLEALTRVPNLAQAINDGSITPKTMRKDVARLKGDDKAKRDKKVSVIKEQAAHIADLEEQLAAADARDGSLFDLKNDSVDDIVAVIVRTVTENKAKSIAAAITKHFKRAKPAG
jgi:hypothetical protein